MIIYAIKNKITGLYLSDGKIYAKTCAKFSDKPRLFKRKVDAINAMNCWLMGVWGRSYYEGECEGPSPPDKKLDDRKAEELKIVSGALVWLE